MYYNNFIILWYFTMCSWAFSRDSWKNSHNIIWYAKPVLRSIFITPGRARVVVTCITTPSPISEHATMNSLLGLTEYDMPRFSVKIKITLYRGVAVYRGGYTAVLIAFKRKQDSRKISDYHWTGKSDSARSHWFVLYVPI